MNREIKFRAWWIAEKTMLHECQDFYDTLGQLDHGNKREPVDSFGQLLDRPDEYIVMQFTGLTDRNGVEIYESDYLSMWYAPGASCKGVVEYEDGAFWFKTTEAKPNKDLVSALTSYGNYIEVIGNVFENPELMEG